MSVMVARELLERCSPLCFCPDGRLVCYKKGRILVYYEEKVVLSIPFPLGRKERFLSFSRLSSRFFRTGIRAAIALDNRRVLLSRKNTIYEMDLCNKTISLGWDCGKGIRPLVFTEIKGIAGFEDGVYFGGYLGNSDKKPVNIYRRVGEDCWEVVYTFGHGFINHVHTLVADPYRQCLWAFTGDFGEAAAIWRIKDGFRSIERVVCNDQKYRACVVHALSEGLLYATDAPFTSNYIYLMSTDTYETEPLYPIHGSCIYGCHWGNYFVFSSTVEGDGRDMKRLEWAFTRKRGAGIKDNYVHMYLFNLKDGLREVYKEKKDYLPYYTFQFGVFMFPHGINNTDSLYFQPVATMKNDSKLMVIRGEDLVRI